LQHWASCFTSIALVLRMRPRFLVPGDYASGKQKTPSKWETWVAFDGLLLPGRRRGH
jgi:hypothetical protein